MSHDYIENDDTETGQCFALFLARTGVISSNMAKLEMVKNFHFQMLFFFYIWKMF